MRVIALAALVACGDNYGLAPDAMRSRVDATTPDASLGRVTVSIGRAHPDVQVFFQAPDSRVLTRTRTNYFGDAAGMIEAGGYVTVINPYGVDERVRVRTFAGVQPGDHLVMHEPNTPDVITGPPYMTVTAPGSSDPTITGYWLRVKPDTHVSNFGSGTTLWVNVEWRPGVTTADFLFLGHDSNNEIRSTLFAGNIPVTSNIDLSAHSQQALVLHSVRYDDVPTTSAVITESLSSERGSLYSVTSPVNVDNGTVAVDLLQPVAPTAFNDFMFEASTGFSTIRLIDRRPYGEQFRTTVQDRLVSEVRTCPVYDATTRTLSWTHAFHKSPNIAVATLEGVRLDWRVIAPLAGTSITVPEIPGYDSVPVRFATLQRAYVPEGLDAVRRAEFWPYWDLATGGAVLGEVRISELTAQNCANL